LPSHGVQDDITLIASRENVTAVGADFESLDLVMDGFDLRLISLVDEVDHPHSIVFLDEIDIRG